MADVGAVTWGNGNTGISGAVSAANSLVGNTLGDEVGGNHVFALSNGNYVVGSSLWNNGPATQAGALTWGNGTTGISGAVTAVNSLVGGNTNDHVGEYLSVQVLSDGSYVVQSKHWRNDAVWPGTNAGAVSWGGGVLPLTGLINGQNSVRGFVTDGGSTMTYAVDPVNHQLIVGRPAENMVTLFRFPRVYLPLVTR